MRSIAFQPCITLGGVYWVEMGQNNDFLQKSGQKTAFLSITILDHPTLDWAGTRNFKGIAKVNMCFKKLEHKLRNELWARRLASILSDSKFSEFFFQSITQNCQKRRILALYHIT